MLDAPPIHHPIGYYVQRAEDYANALASGEFSSLRALSRKEGISPARVCQLLRLHRLDEGIRADLKTNGNGWTVRRLYSLAPLPKEEQRSAYFEPQKPGNGARQRQ